MGINSNVVKNYQTAEYGKFVELVNSSQFPPVSVVRLSYPDTSSAFPSNSGLGPLSSVDIYPKYAVLSYIANPEDISVSLSAGNINVNLADLEDIARTINQNVSSTNTRLSGIDIILSTINRNISASNTNQTSINQNTSALNIKRYAQTSTNLISSVTLPACFVTEIYGNSYAGYDQYIQIVNSNNALPVFVGKIKSGETFTFDFTTSIILSSSGVIRNSLTPMSFTQALEDMNLTVKYLI